MHLGDRRQAILNAIIWEFIQSAEPVGSHTIVVSYNLSVSPATIRNEMVELEEEGLIYQPHTSAGRVPTDLGYRLFVDELADYETARKEAEKTLTRIAQAYQLKKAREKIYDAVSIIAQATENVSFATLPDNKRTFYLGLSNVLRQPEFRRDPLRASQVIEMLENTNRFLAILHNLAIDDSVKIFIGKENLLEEIQSCSMLVTRYEFSGFSPGFIGILGPTRMKYPFNQAVLEKVKEAFIN